MKTTEIRQLSLSEIIKEINKSKHELLKIKLQTGSSQSKETHKIKDLRKFTARMKTVQTELSKSVN